MRWGVTAAVTISLLQWLVGEWMAGCIVQYITPGSHKQIEWAVMLLV
jgi:hypothetical protein